jgi:hypothetical protein
MRFHIVHQTVLTLACSLLATTLGLEVSAARDKLPPDLQPSEVNVTTDMNYRWGEPGVGVNPKNPNNLVYNVLRDSYTYKCQKAKTADCALDKVVPPGRSEVMGVPHGAFSRRKFGENWIGNEVYYSFDRGKTWTKAKLPRKIPGKPAFDPTGAFGGDPVVKTTSDGTFWISFEPIVHDRYPLESPGNYGCVVVVKSTDGGKTWSDPHCTGTPIDHEWFDIDESTGTLFMASSGRLGPTSAGDPNAPVSEISDRWLTTSKDGVTWSSPVPMGGSDGARHYSAGGRVVASNGVMATVFTARSLAACKFFLGIDEATCTVFQTTTDAGKTWKRTRVPTAPDVGAGLIAGNAKKPGHYVVAGTDAKGGQIHVYRTSDGGMSWSGPTIVSADPAKQHFKVGMASSPNGAIGLVWRLRQSIAGTGQGATNVGPYNVWASLSDNDGATFHEPLKISGSDSPGEDMSLPVGYDDTSDIALNEEYAFLAWADWRPGDRQGYFGAIKLAALRHK